jgi:predicted ribosomally synthesized peptide with SipW-like signal peptide
MIKERSEKEKMKSIFLSVVIICALAISGIGGTLATWSDSETSFDNLIETGSVDLQVNYLDDKPWGAGVGPKVEIECMMPSVWYGPYLVELWHGGQCDYPSKAFIHVKDVDCFNLDPKPETGYVGPDGLWKCEPELVAEFGGKVNCVEVTGIGPEGDDCSMGSHVLMVVTDTPVPPYEVDPDRTVDLRDKLGKWECVEKYLFDLWPCQPRNIYLWFFLQQDSEEDWGKPDLIVHPDDMDPVPEGDKYDAALQHWMKFNDWPSWALMKDGVYFDMEFDLWLDTSEIDVPIDPRD